eukprot:CAMPEP_0194401246 /NCGR_PEP_ID=MMETSP0174-20130528/127697_1 /TAXON_ID=216777 /ORGANISM="Proboscia alata, Strain PI-D3" /LENGTH=1408 /DNA_ID=CAMNT_0039197921 /DNA_START=947 /DNA_END=5173 /DNA_ORIENTATION=+
MDIPSPPPQEVITNNRHYKKRGRIKLDLLFEKESVEMMQRVFLIMDTHNRGVLFKHEVEDFIQRFCPLFRRRDDAKKEALSSLCNRGESGKNDVGEIGSGVLRSTFDEIWDDVITTGFTMEEGSKRAEGKSQERTKIKEQGDQHSCLVGNSNKNMKCTRWEDSISIGVEAWMVFCKFISLAQYQEATQMRFSTRHRQSKIPNSQTSESRKSSSHGRRNISKMSTSSLLSSKQQSRRRHTTTMEVHEEDEEGELVVVDLPPLSPPEPLEMRNLLEYELNCANATGLGMPELNLDHYHLSSLHVNDSSSYTRCHSSPSSLLLAHKCHDRSSRRHGKSWVKVSVVSKSSSFSQPSSSSRRGCAEEFIITFHNSLTPCASGEETHSFVRRTLPDLAWLQDTIDSDRSTFGGMLCGRILPPFPSTSSGLLSSIALPLSLNMSIKSPSSFSPSSQQQLKNDSNASIAAGDNARSLFNENSVGWVDGSGVAGEASRIFTDAASSGMGVFKSFAKSLIKGGTVSGNSSNVRSGKREATKKNTASKIATARIVTESTPPKDTIISSSKSFQISSMSIISKKDDEDVDMASLCERYLNYLLHHPILSASFPLYVLLNASSAGLEAAKRITTDEKDRRQKRGSAGQGDESTATSSPMQSQDQTISADDFEHLPSPSCYDYNTNSNNINTKHGTNDAAWMRTAAQAAVSLQLHDLLDATGMSYASSRLQHASLPQFDSTRNWRETNEDLWVENNTDSSSFTAEKNRQSGLRSGSKRIDEVVTVQSELDKDVLGSYDLLPILPSGSILEGESDTNIETLSGLRSLPDIPVHLLRNGNVDQLHNILSSMSSVLHRSLSIFRSFSSSRRDSLSAQLDLVRELDSHHGSNGAAVTFDNQSMWNITMMQKERNGGGGGGFLEERACLRGVAALEESLDAMEKSNTKIKEALSWQASLSISAISATEEVQTAIRASKTGTAAKTAAQLAAQAAHKAYQTIDSNCHPNDARAAETRVAISHRHAIRAAVIEHNAFVAKRKSVCHLAQDIQCWDDHRKAGLRDLCWKMAIEGRNAARKGVETWRVLREGLVENRVGDEGYRIEVAQQQRQQLETTRDAQTVDLPPSSVMWNPVGSVEQQHFSLLQPDDSYNAGAGAQQRHKNEMKNVHKCNNPSTESYQSRKKAHHHDSIIAATSSKSNCISKMKEQHHLNRTKSNEKSFSHSSRSVNSPSIATKDLSLPIAKNIGKLHPPKKINISPNDRKPPINENFNDAPTLDTSTMGDDKRATHVKNERDSRSQESLLILKEEEESFHSTQQTNASSQNLLIDNSIKEIYYDTTNQNNRIRVGAATDGVSRTTTKNVRDDDSKSKIIVDKNSKITQNKTSNNSSTMTSSMQSLVDGLIAWGSDAGSYDFQHDISLLSNDGVLDA